MAGMNGYGEKKAASIINQPGVTCMEGRKGRREEGWRCKNSRGREGGSEN